MKKHYLIFMVLLAGIAVFADPFYINLHNTGISKIKTGNYDDALKDLRVSSFGFLNDRQMLTESYVAMTVIYYRKEDIEGIKEYMEKLSEIDYEDYINGVDAYLMGDFNLVLSLLKEEIIETEPEAVEVMAEKSRKEILTEQKKRSGLNMDEIRELVLIYYDEKNYPGINSLLLPMRNQIDSRPDLWLYWGAGQFAERNYRDADRSLERYANLSREKDDLYYYLKAHLSARDKKWDRADEYLGKVVNRKRFEDYDALRANIDANIPTEDVRSSEQTEAIEMAELERLAESGDYVGIIKKLEGSRLISDGRYAFVLANAYFQVQSFQKCIDLINRIDTRNLSDRQKIRLNYFLGISYLNTGNNRAGCQHLRTAGKGRNMLEVSEAENTVRNIVEADCMTYTEIVNEYNRNKQDHYNILAIAFAEYRQKRYQQSITYFRVIRNKDNNHLYANYYLGINNYYTGNYKESIRYYNHLISLGYRFDALYYRLGLAYYGDQDYRKALEYFDMVYDSLEDRSQFLEIYNDAKSRADQN